MRTAEYNMLAQLISELKSEVRGMRNGLDCKIKYRKADVIEFFSSLNA